MPSGMNEKEKYSHRFFEKMPSYLYPIYLKKIYMDVMGKGLDLKNPKLFTEKIQWIKLNDNIPIKTQWSDKLLLRNLVSEKVPELGFPKVYTHGNNFEELDFNVCPNEFIIKTNHAWKQNYFVSDKNKFLANNNKEYNTVRYLFNYYLSRHFAFSSGFEMQYKDINRKVYVEEFIRGNSISLDLNYKIYCFNGVPRIIEHYITDEGKIDNSRIAVFDTGWKQLDVEYLYPKYQGMPIPPPENLNKMLEYSKTLSKDFKFVRIDFLNTCEKLYLSEMTFTPSSGFIFFNPPEYDAILGQMLNL